MWTIGKIYWSEYRLECSSYTLIFIPLSKRKERNSIIYDCLWLYSDEMPASIGKFRPIYLDSFAGETAREIS